MPYGLTSDNHAHNWTAFATTDSDGVNSRLKLICAELERAGDEVLAAGGETLYGAGDLLHTRGSISPTVLNPLQDTIRRMCAKGLKLRLIPGNHDLEGKESDEIGNAVRALADIEGVTVCDRPTIFDDDQVAMLPWCSSVVDLLEHAGRLAEELDRTMLGVRAFDLIIHAPVDDVIYGIPSHGLDAETLSRIGFKRVFAGHYHHHKDFGNGVFSIGASTHQTWGDVGTKAGFLLVSTDSVKFRASRAPEFIDILQEDVADEATVALRVDGNYVRFKGASMTDAEIKEAREALMAMGARGVVVHATRASASERTTASPKTSASLEASTGQFIKDKGYERADELAALCTDILTEARASE